ncbi:MAG: Asp-tRNA(Asn)/Glu-tRNA(Gln) amidotransferase subunit GatB [Alphaproteobacteria bacterium]|nr:Asp-tRNA(Asn)/Glu-tRNA(Gln) amidotransferase subunit GatB [Alphaproteobacteria bacterium]
MSLIQGATGDWEVVIGLEIHAQVTSAAKLFSGAAAAFGGEPNARVSLVDAAMPGMLPVINGYCVEQAVRTGLGLKAEINLTSVFDRKNYFYPDLPQGYQISQFTQPIVGSGEVILDMADGTERRVGITRLHLEQDAGKSLHDQAPNATYVDLNRSGVALMEIVSEPDIRSPEEAAVYLAKMRSILRYLGTCDGNMEEGSMRADVNVSVRKPGDELGTRCEIKNLNSIRFVCQAIVFESARQVALIEDGGEVVQQTRLFDPEAGVTRVMRSKEESHDYRYFPDPDLLPLELDADWVASIKADLPELPDEKRARWHADFGLPLETINALILDREIADATEEEIGKLVQTRNQELASKYFCDQQVTQTELKTEERQLLRESAQQVANMTRNKIFHAANVLGRPVPEVMKKIDVSGLIHLVSQGEISSTGANTAIEKSAASTTSFVPALEAAKMWNLKLIDDDSVVETEVDRVIAASPDQVAQFRAGNEKVLGWFVGQVMKATGGKANPGAVNEMLRKKLAE